MVSNPNILGIQISNIEFLLFSTAAFLFAQFLFNFFSSFFYEFLGFKENNIRDQLGVVGIVIILTILGITFINIDVRNSISL